MRTKVICIDLRATLKKDLPNSERRKILTIFNKLSGHCETYRRLTGLITIFVYIRKIDQGFEVHKLNKNFFDKCWGALDFKAGGSSRRNEFYDLCSEFVEQCNFDVFLFPPSMKMRIRESITAEMATVANTSISNNMENKISSHIHRSLDKFHYFSDADPSYKPVIRRRLEELRISTDFEIPSNFVEYTPIVESVRLYVKEIWTLHSEHSNKGIKYLLNQTFS